MRRLNSDPNMFFNVQIAAPPQLSCWGNHEARVLTEIKRTLFSNLEIFLVIFGWIPFTVWHYIYSHSNDLAINKFIIDSFPFVCRIRNVLFVVYLIITLKNA